MKLGSLLVGAALGACAAVAAVKYGPQIKETVEAKVKKAKEGSEVEDTCTDEAVEETAEETTEETIDAE